MSSATTDALPYVPPNVPSNTAATIDTSGATGPRLLRKGWAVQLFSADLPHASALLRQELADSVNAPMPSADRLRMTEVARVLVMGLHNKWRRVYKTHAEAFAEDAVLWQELWAHYSISLRPLLDGDADLAAQKTMFLQRALFVGKQLRLIHALARQPFPDKLWQEIHAYYRFSEMLECPFDNIADKLSSMENRVSCYSTYMHTLLFDLSNPNLMSDQQMLWVDRWLPRMARKLQTVDTSAPQQAGLFLEVRLDSSQGGSLRARLKNPSPLTRAADLDDLAKTLRRRRRYLITGETPARLKLGEDIDSDQASTLLAHLESAWCPPDLSHATDAPQFDWEAQKS